MKKRLPKHLKLSKKSISNLSNTIIYGGRLDTSFDNPCEPNSDILNGASCDCLPPFSYYCSIGCTDGCQD